MYCGVKCSRVAPCCLRWTQHLQNVICEKRRYGWTVFIDGLEYCKKNNIVHENYARQWMDEFENLLFINTCNAWLSGVPFSKWYGMTVVKYFGSVPGIRIKFKLQFMEINAWLDPAAVQIIALTGGWRFSLCFATFLFHVILSPFVLYRKQKWNKCIFHLFFVLQFVAQC